MKPGMRENEAVGLVKQSSLRSGSEYVEAVNAISGERCNPAAVLSKPYVARNLSGLRLESQNGFS